MKLLIGKNPDYQISLSLITQENERNILFMINFNLFSGRITPRMERPYSQSYLGLEHVFEQYELYAYKEELEEAYKILENKINRFYGRNLVTVLIIKKMLKDKIKELGGH